MTLRSKLVRAISRVRDLWFWIDQKVPRCEDRLTEEALADAENGAQRVRKHLRGPKAGRSK